MIRGLCPVGSFIGWAKSFSKTPSLIFQGRTEWVEANGQTLSDANSDYDGLVMPSLNSGQTRFLRGGATSGTTAGSTNHTHTITSSSSSTQSGSSFIVVTSVTSPTGNQNIQPIQSYDVVWLFCVR